MYLKHVQQADTGCDFDFLAPDYRENTDNAPAEGEPEIH
jgi:dihydroxy-acid dehydratase